jgi:hypothetical protein
MNAPALLNPQLDPDAGDQLRQAADEGRPNRRRLGQVLSAFTSRRAVHAALTTAGGRLIERLTVPGVEM